MTLSTSECIAAITRHSTGLAEAVQGNLQARVEHCPAWSVADLVWHLTEVQWFWATIAEERLDSPPEEGRRPPRTDAAGLVPVFEAGAGRLASVLRDADQSAPCWTWARWQQDVAFVTRHQVQEAAVHHWDAVHASGGDVTIEPDVAVDSVDEFLHFSVASEDDPDEPTTPALHGTVAFRAADTGDVWTLTDGARPGTAKVTPDLGGGVPVLEAAASDLLLWLYGRVSVDTSAVPVDLLARFHGICSTD